MFSLLCFCVCSTGARLFSVRVVGYDDYTRKILEDDVAAGPQVLYHQQNTICVGGYMYSQFLFIYAGYIMDYMYRAASTY